MQARPSWGGRHSGPTITAPEIAGEGAAGGLPDSNAVEQKGGRAKGGTEGIMALPAEGFLGSRAGNGEGGGGLQGDGGSEVARGGNPAVVAPTVEIAGKRIDFDAWPKR